MGIILRRATILPIDEKQEIEMRLDMYDELIEQDPKMQRIRAESEAKGIEKGQIEGEQKFIILAIQTRFPSLVTFAAKKVKQITQPDILTALVSNLMTAPDGNSIRAFIDSIPV